MKSTEHRRAWHFNIMLVVLAVAGLIAVLIAIDPMARAAQESHVGWAGHYGMRATGMEICSGGHDNRLDQVGGHV